MREIPLDEFTPMDDVQPTKKQFGGGLKEIPLDQFVSLEDETAKRVIPEDAPDVSEGMTPVEAFLTSMGRGFTTIGRGLNLGKEFGIESPIEEGVVTDAMTQLEERHPIATTTGEIAGEVLPALAMSAGLPTPAALPARMLTTGGIGAMEGGIIERGRNKSGLSGAATGAGIGAASEILTPYIGRIGAKIYNKLKGKRPTGSLLDNFGKPTKELNEVLEEAELTFDDLTDQAVKDIEASGGRVEPKQAARKALLESQGLEPTRPQLTRDATDFQKQQEAYKTSGRVRTAIDNQEAVLTTRFNDAVRETGGAARGSTVADAVVEKATVLDAAIGDLYKQARELAPGAKNVKFNSLTALLKRSVHADRKTKGNISAIIGELQNIGILDKNMKVQGKVAVETAEEIRKLANELYDPQNGYGNMVLRQLKDALDDDVFKAAGDDVFRQARKAKADFEKGLTRAKVSKFDSRRQNLLRDILENKIAPDDMVKKVVLGRTWRPSDLQQVKSYVGAEAWKDLRADVINTIKDKAMIGADDADGFRAISRDKLEKVLSDTIGWDKLGVILDPQEVKFLRNMLGVAKIREPVRGTALGQGPSAQAVKSLERKLEKLPIIGDLVSFIGFDGSGRFVMKAKPMQVIGEAERQLPMAVSGAAIPAVNQYKEQE